VIGSADTVRDGLLALQQATKADEMILVSDIFDPALRQRSLEITAGIFNGGGIQH
jgi:alkanesulfonate monooxygenase SsuD/methylene tetrahydromethanopterin reductase-like flavin-dependent oxidoreductase (luciferase family)